MYNHVMLFKQILLLQGKLCININLKVTHKGDRDLFLLETFYRPLSKYSF